MNFNITYNGTNFTITFEDGTTIVYTSDKTEPISNFTSFLDGIIYAGKAHKSNAEKECNQTCKCKIPSTKEAEQNIADFFNKYF